MSRVRSTLDTVSKAVSGTHTDLLSKIARLKPNALKAKQTSEPSVESTPKAEQSELKPSPGPTPPGPPLSTSAAKFDATATTSTLPLTPTQPTVTTTVPTVPEHKEKRLKPTVKASSARKQEELLPSLNENEREKGTTSKQTTALFHPSTFSVSLDETYNYLAHHINSYFGSSTKTQDKKLDNANNSSPSSQDQQTSHLMLVSDKTDPASPVTRPSAKKSLGQYLSYSGPTVQAFVGNYIAPLVPKFRTVESKVPTVEEKKSEEVSVKQAEATITQEQKAAEEKAKKLLLQREKVCLQQS